MMLLTFLVTKTSSDQFGIQPFAKMFLYFDILTISNNITNFKYMIFINFFSRVTKHVSFYISRFHFNCSMVCIVVFINYVIQFFNLYIF